MVRRDLTRIAQSNVRGVRIFPIMHTAVIKREVLDQNPWVAVTPAKAFEEAKALALEASPRRALPVWAAVSGRPCL
jgi:4,5-dihydroxyphthalate decarboxylase